MNKRNILFCLILSLPLFYCDNSSTEDIGYFWHITDFHLDTNFSSNDNGKQLNDQRDYFIGDYAYDVCWGKAQGKFGDYNCDSSEELVKSATQFIKQYSEGLSNVPFILWTGDDTAHVNDSYGSPEEAYEAIEIITLYLNQTGLKVFPVLGNHDAYPHNQFHDNPENELYQKTAEIWKDSFGWPNEAYQQYRTNGGFYKVQHGPFLMVGLNSNIWYRSNKVNFTNPVDPSGQFKWLEKTLEDAKQNDKKVFLFTHIPPGKFERFYQEFEDSYGFPWFKEDYNFRYLQILQEYADTIHLQLYGHHHTDTFKLIRNQPDFDGTGLENEVIGVGILAPAVTPWNSTLAPETGANNPAIRLFKYNIKTGEILDYEQFWLDLNEANQNGTANWKSEYVFKEYFGVKNLTHQAFEEIFQKMSEDSEYFDKYHQINSVQKPDIDCDENCRGYHLCAISQQDYQYFDQCVEKA